MLTMEDSLLQYVVYLKNKIFRPFSLTKEI